MPSKFKRLPTVFVALVFAAVFALYATPTRPGNESTSMASQESSRASLGARPMLRGAKDVWDSLYRAGHTTSWLEHINALDPDVCVLR